MYDMYDMYWLVLKWDTCVHNNDLSLLDLIGMKRKGETTHFFAFGVECSVLQSPQEGLFGIKESRGSGYLKQERIKEPSLVLVISKTSQTKTDTLKFLNPTKTDVQFRNQTI
jgi:hypothetical protein